MNLPDRVVLVDKPQGVTSFDMVRRLRQGTRGRVGHAGTLDPFASGLLLLMTGKATRLSSLLMSLPKEYEMVVQFGAESTTGDPTGQIRPGGRPVAGAEVVRALDGFRGRLRQRVPLTSAVKIDGEPLYKRAHRGEDVETPEREVTVYDAVLTDFDVEGQRASVLALVGKGTYMRVLAADLGKALGSQAYAASLRRTRIGPFQVSRALGAQELHREALVRGGPGVMSPEEALSFLPRLDVDDRLAQRVTNGNELRPFPEGRFRVHGPGGLLALYEGRAGTGRPLVVFSPQPS